jgi:membrane-bound lytic murein transglycosylase D
VAFETRDVETTSLTLEREASLGELTICLGQALDAPAGWFRTLRNLNPRIEPSERVPAGEAIEIPSGLVESYRERCLDSPIVSAAAELHDADYPDEPEMIIYTVRRGDTLGKIASRHRCTGVRQLAALNNIRAPRYIIRPGQRLKIPPCR